MVETDAVNHLSPPMAWDRWGDPSLANPLSAGIRALLEQALGVGGTEIAAPGIDDVRLSPGTLAPQHRDALADIVGSDDLIEKIQGGFLDFDAAIAPRIRWPRWAGSPACWARAA